MINHGSWRATEQSRTLYATGKVAFRLSSRQARTTLTERNRGVYVRHPLLCASIVVLHTSLLSSRGLMAAVSTPSQSLHGQTSGWSLITGRTEIGAWDSWPPMPCNAQSLRLTLLSMLVRTYRRWRRSGINSETFK